MRKTVHMCGCRIYLTGTKITIKRDVYTDGKRYFIKYGAVYAEVVGTPGCTSGWRTVLDY